MNKILKLISVAVIVVSSLSALSMDYGMAAADGNDIYDTICKDPYDNNYHYDEHGFDIILGENDPIPFTHTETASGITLHLFVAPTYHISYPEFTEDTIFWCDNEPFPESEYGFLIMELLPGTNTYSDTLKTIYGCDSVISIEITTLPSINILIEDTICDETSYTNDTLGISLDDLHQGMNVNTLPYEGDDPTGCGGTITTRLLVGMTNETTIFIKTCDSTGYHENGFDIPYLPQGPHQLQTTLTNSNGCDSILYINLLVSKTKKREYTINRCREDMPYIDSLFYIESQDEPMKRYDTVLQTTNGCDSTVIMTLMIHQVRDTLLTDTICSDELPYNKFGFHYSDLQPDSTYHFEKNVGSLLPHSCDSTVYLDLTVMPSIHDIYNEIACLGKPYTKHGFNDTIWTFDDDTLFRYNHTPFGCDSTVTVYLDVVPPTFGSVTDTICDQDSYHKNGFSLDGLESGIHYDTLYTTSESGCDSTVFLKLYVGNSQDIHHIYDTICFWQEYTEYNFLINKKPLIPGDPFYLTQEGDNNYFDTIKSSLGCDSIVWLHLFSYPDFTTTIFPYHCYEDPPTIPPGYDSIYPIFLTSVTTGCDSSIYLTDIYGYEFSYYFDVYDTVCIDDRYDEAGIDTVFQETGLHIFTINHISSMGCDSVADYYIQVGQVYDTILYDTICQGEPYDEYNFHPGEDIFYPGLHTYNTICQTTFGCDSLVALKLYVKPSYSTYYSYEYCDSVHFQELGFDTIFNEEGCYCLVDSLKNIFGCDSITTAYINIYKNKFKEIKDTVCLGDEYYKYGFEIPPLTELGLTYDTLFGLKTTTGCDSTVYLELDVLPQYDIDDFDTICHGQDYNGHGLHWTSVQWDGTINYDTTYHTVGGCDSTIWLHLYVAPIYYTAFADTIEAGSDYHGYGFDTINPPVGIHNLQNNLHTILGCDSIVYLTLHVTTTYETVFDDTICHGDGYYEHGFTIEGSEIDTGLYYYSLNLLSIYGRDSIVRLNLLVTPVYDTTIRDTICFGEEYHLHGFDYNNSDEYEVGINNDTLFLNTVFGCDSTVCLELYVAPVYAQTIYGTICHGEEYHEYGFDFNGPDDYGIGLNYDTLFEKTALGCDSIVRIELYVAPLYDITIYDTSCYGDEYHEHGFYLDASDSLVVGMNYDTLFLSSIYDCDSVVKLQLFVGAVYDITLYDTTCVNEGYHLQGFDLDSLDVGLNHNMIVFETANGCDSVIHLELLANPTYDIPLADTICEGETYNNYGFVYNDPDSLHIGMNYSTLYLQSIDGCDSIVTMGLLVGEIKHEYYNDTTCEGVPYDRYGFDYPDPQVNDTGFIMIHLDDHSILGCDSTTTLRLVVYPSYDDIGFSDTICYGNGYYEHGFNLSSIGLELGINHDTLFLTTAHGCDSTICLDLYVAPQDSITLQDTTCVNEGYHSNGFDLDDLEPGMIYNTLFLYSAAGCDSVVMLELYVKPFSTTTIQDTVCSGDEYHEHGFNLYNLEVGNLNDTLFNTTTLGCDSLICLELLVAPTYDNIDIYDTVCYNDIPNTYYGIDSIVVGMNHDTVYLETVFGCDSIVMLNLFVNETYDIHLSDDICIGENYNNYGFNFENPSLGTHTGALSLTSDDGCDSIVTLTLKVTPNYSFSVLDSICEGDDYTHYDLDIPQPEPGYYNLTSYLNTAYGCDSVFNINLKVIQKLLSIGEIHGFNQNYSGTDLIPGSYKYWVDDIQGADEYIWTFSNDEWQVIETNRDTCVILIQSPITNTLTVIARNSCGEVSTSLDITASFFGVGENGDINVNVYPNPSNGYVNVEGDDIEAVNVVNTTGVIVKKFKFDDENSVTIDISDLPNALYVLEIVTRDGKCLRRVTKTGY